jgi:hypothetical protein
MKRQTGRQAFPYWLALVLATLGLSGCGVLSENVITDIHGNTTTKHGAYLAAQVAAMEAQKPIFELVAQEGQTIILAGVKEIRVHGPQASASEIKPYVSPGYALVQNLAQTALFPFFSWAMIREVMPWTQPQVVDPLVVNPQVVNPLVVNPLVIQTGPAP